MATTNLTNSNFWTEMFKTIITAISDTDSVTVKTADGTDSLITAELLRAYLQKGITPTIGTDGYWYIGGVLVKDASGNPLQISAAGQTPTIALKTIGGIKAIYVTYKGASAADSDWILLVTASDLMFTFDDLTDVQKQSFLTYFTDAITNCNTATANANTATQTANTAASNANAATKSATDAAASATAATVPSDYTSGVSEGIAHDKGEADSNRDNYNSGELGDVHADSLDVDVMPTICKQPMVISGTAAPSQIPDHTGQIYIDTVNSVAYIAVFNSTTANWKQITN